MTKRIRYVRWIDGGGTHDERMARVQTDPARHHAYYSRLIECDEHGKPLTTQDAASEPPAQDAARAARAPR